MCGRYALALRPSQVRQYLQDENMQVDEAPDDEGDGAPRQSYNFAPGYHGIVYRADVPDYGAGPRQHKKGEGEPTEEEASTESTMETDQGEVRYKLQSMKWGLIPFWTKRNPDYGSMMRTINCRDDSLIENKGMWNTMKQRKRCIVVAQGFYEWLKKGKEKVPHFTKRKDGQLMCFAGLWDCVQYDDSEEKHYTYTVITTDSNKQLKFLHDRMPVILENGSEDIKTWLDPQRHTWSKELQSLLRSTDTELECYPVSKEVGKVGNNSPNFIIPVASSENKSNIANFFSKGGAKPETTIASTKMKSESPKKEEPLTDSQTEELLTQIKEEEGEDRKTVDHNGSEDNAPLSTPKEESKEDIKHEEGEDRKTVDHNGTEDNAPLPVPKEEAKQGIKRAIDDVPDVEEQPKKSQKTSESPSKPSSTAAKSGRKTRSATSNNTASPVKTDGKDKGSKKITSFFKEE